MNKNVSNIIRSSVIQEHISILGNVKLVHKEVNEDGTHESKKNDQ